MKDEFIILPGYNEEKHVEKVINSIQKEGYKNIIFVDDGSKDATVKKAFKTKAIILRHKTNLGKGAATKTGCDYAIKEGAKTLILMDSDGQHEAKDIKKLTDALKGKDIVFGYRKFNKKMPVTMRLGNHFLTIASKILFSIHIKDTQSGFRCFTDKAYKKIRWYSRDYGMESEMIAKTSKHRLKYAEIPIKTIYHDAHKGTTPLDGIKILFNMIRHRLFNMKTKQKK
jgi:UDP-N-acetylglucosamine---dolichyl-phosphate N-acetylglucosaminyltransferase